MAMEFIILFPVPQECSIPKYNENWPDFSEKLIVFNRRHAITDNQPVATITNWCDFWYCARRAMIGPEWPSGSIEENMNICKTHSRRNEYWFNHN